MKDFLISFVVGSAVVGWAAWFAWFFWQWEYSGQVSNIVLGVFVVIGCICWLAILGDAVRAFFGKDQTP